MKKRHLWLLALSFILSICTCFSLAACNGCNGDEITPVALAVPVVSIDGEGVATWDSVPNASGYAYKINDGEENTTSDCSVTLTDKQSISVKAVGDGKNYTDSEWSQAKTYTASAPVQPVKLGKPVVTLNGAVASWNAVENASGYKYSLDNGTTWADATGTSVTLTDKQTVIVKAIGDGENYTDGDASDPVTYNAATPVQHSHDYVWTDNNDGTHSGVCTNKEGECDAPTITNQAHVYDENDECVCGAKKPAPSPAQHSHDYVWTDNHDGTHSGVCKGEGECDAPTITNQAHVYGENDKCVCGAVKPDDNTEPVENGVVFNFDKAVTQASTAAYTADEAQKAFNSAINDKEIAFTVTNASSLFPGNGEDVGFIKFSSGSNNGSITLTFTDKAVTKVVIVAKVYVGTNGKADISTLTVNGSSSEQITTEKATYTFDVEATNRVTISAVKRCFVYSITVTFGTPSLAAPVVTVDDDGVATWGEVPNAIGYKYVITTNGVEADPVSTTNRSVTLTDGQSIKVMAVGDGVNYNDDNPYSDVVAYNKIQLAAPVVTKSGNNGAKWTAVPNATKYGYTITKADGTVVNDETAETSIKLDNGDKIVVWAIGTGKYKDSVKSNEFEFEKLSEVDLDTPTFSIDRKGVVTIDEHSDTKIFKYVIGDYNTLADARLEGTIGTLEVTVVTGEISVPSGKAIVILAGGYTNDEDGTIYKDSDWTVPAIYKAPAGTFDKIDDELIEFSLADGKVGVEWAHDGKEFEIVVNGTSETINEQEIVLDFKAYDEIKIKVLATNPESGYDYSGCYDESEYLDITDSFNTFVANEKIEVEKTALDNFLPDKVVEDKEFELIMVGTTYSDVVIAWTIENVITDIVRIEGDKLIIRPTADLTEINVVATLTCGTSSGTKEFPIEIKKLETTSEEFTFTADSTLDGMKGDLAEMSISNNGGNTNPTYNSGDKAVRAYPKNVITVKAEGQAIIKIELTYTTNGAVGEITADKGTYSNTDKVWSGNGTETEVKLTIGGASGHIKLTKLVVTYVTPNYTDAEKVEKAFAALPENIDFIIGGFNLDVDGIFGTSINWTVTLEDGTTPSTAVTIDENGHATVNRGDDDVTVKIHARVTLNGETSELKTYGPFTVTKIGTVEEKEILKLLASDFPTSYPTTSTEYKAKGVDGSTEYTFTALQVGHFSNSGKIQMKKSEGVITITGTFTKIVIVVNGTAVPTVTSNKTTITESTDGSTHTYTFSSYEEQTITIKAASSATYMDSISFYAIA